MSMNPAPPAADALAPPPPPAPKRSSAATILLVVGLVVGIGIIGVGVFATLAIYGARKYLARAKEAEARVTLATMAKSAVTAFEGNPGASEGARSRGRICPSAASPVPASIGAIAGRKYQSSASEWSSDPGFGCLGFSLSAPQYYQYDYRSTPGSFVALAHGDLDGDGDLSRFELEGHLDGGDLVVAPAVKATDPDE